MGDSHYLEADGQVAAKPHKPLRTALERSAQVAVAKFAWPDRERLGLLRIKSDVIVSHATTWDAEPRSPEEPVPREVDVADDEVEATIRLREAMVQDDIGHLTDPSARRAAGVAHEESSPRQSGATEIHGARGVDPCRCTRIDRRVLTPCCGSAAAGAGVVYVALAARRFFPDSISSSADPADLPEGSGRV
ncbi:Ku family protein [Streptomyces violascens]|uniref:hypothetical protein n=1 Tax=Streptomyces violascens TaxID=67381 RepID=UPI00364829CF